jgi:tetratricopeptide (TPR) repeat protein
MKPAIVLALLAASLSSLWQAMTRPTNSHASARRGVEQYGHRQYEAAAESFKDAAAIKLTPESSFNLGTAQIAVGRRAEGANALARAISDPPLKADALYNRGNSALAAQAFEHAVRDYAEALRLRPGDGQAKRNLEIALNRLRAMQQAGGQQPQPQGASPQQQQRQPSPSPREGDQEQQEADSEALLRSVQQQEQEELQRMKRARGESVRVGW